MSKVKGLKSEAEKYDKKTPREHVLLRPDTYIGDIEPTSEPMWIYSSEDKNMIKAWKEIGVRFVQNQRTKQQMPHNYIQYLIKIEYTCTISNKITEEVLIQQ